MVSLPARAACHRPPTAAPPPSQLPPTACPQEFGGAISDASRALELDPPPALRAKALYRRGDASFALGHLKDAVRDFRAAIRLAPSDPDLRRKVR